MAAPIGKGDWVEWIAAGDWFGRVFQVADLVDSGECVSCGDTGQGVELAGVQDEWAFCPSCQLRPIYRPKAELIEQLKAPPKAAPVKEHEAA